MNTSYKISLLFFMLMISVSMYSQKTASKSINKTFNLTNTGELFLNNKYGDVIINGWEKDEIKIAIDIKVSHKKKDDAELLIERIVPEIKNTDNTVYIKSIIKEKSQSFFYKYFNKINPVDINKGNIDINYTIYLPINAEINITNKFGDIIIDNYKGKLKTSIEHGDLWINNNLTDADINMKFGKLTTKSIAYASINLKNGNLNIEKSKRLYLKTNGSNINIGTGTDIELYSSKDEINIKNAEKIKGSLKFSNVKIDTLSNRINMDMNIAELRVSKITKANTEVYINQKSSEIHINIKELSFNFNATLEQGLLRLPKTFSNIKTTVIDKNKRIREISGNYGNTTPGIFVLNGKKGIIILNE